MASQKGGEMPTIQVVKVNGEKLRRLRERRLLSRAELGERAHLDPDHIGRIERGETKTPRMANIRALAAALEVDASEFLEDWEGE
jgi:transcriptional regulator with XRE-family HTH domain